MWHRTSTHGPWVRHIYPSLVLVQPRKTRPYITERLLMGRKESNQTKQKTKTSTHVWNQAVFHEISRPVAAGMSLKFALKQQAYVIQLHLTTWHVGYNNYCTLTACMSVRVAPHQQKCLNQLQLTSNHICSCGGSTSRYICYTCLRPAVMSLCLHQTNRLVSTIPPDHQSCMLQLHLTSSHVFIICLLSACMSVTVSSYQHPCILHLHQTINHVCKDCIWPFAMPFIVALTSSHVC